MTNKQKDAESIRELLNLCTTHTFPAISCSYRSAWHTWSTMGALYALKHPENDFEKAANYFAGQESHKDAPSYTSKLRAFLQGTENVDKLERIKK